MDFGGVLTTDDIARDGNIWSTDGMDLSRFLRTKTINFDHNTAWPVARITELTKEPGKIRFKARFSAPGVSQKADEVRGQVKDGTINSLSAAIIPLEMEPLLDKSRRQVGWRITKSDLIDFAIVSSPANANCLITERSIAALTQEPVNMPSPSTEGPKTFKRDLYDCGWLAQMLQSLACLQQFAEWEAEDEGDGSPIPGMIAEAVKTLGNILVQMTAEEVSELLASVDGADRATDTPAQRILKAMSKRSVPPQKRYVIEVPGKLSPNAAKHMEASVELWRKNPDKIMVLDDGAVLREFGSSVITSVETRSGRVLSADNERCVREAHGHLTEAITGLEGLLGQVTPDDSEEPEEPDPEIERARALAEIDIMKLSS
ncbi:MAG: hypothetical protein F8N39_07265 [Clostridiaceae bacterium]|nr:hypothetical protein [Clostridiaceae bacterium]